MSLRSRNAFVSCIVWIIILVVFFILFFQGNGPIEWGGNRTLRVVSAILFGLGYLVHLIMLFQDKKEPLDERTKMVQLKSTNVTMVITLIYVFLFCIILYTHYEYDGFVPVAWFWFMGYSTVFITFALNSFLYLLIEKRDISYENK